MIAMSARAAKTSEESAAGPPAVIPLSPFITENFWHAIGARLRLSKRQVQIIQAVFNDRKELGIAHELGISPHTVRTHLGRLYTKLNVQSRVALVTTIVGEFFTILRERGILPHSLGDADTARPDTLLSGSK